MRKFVLLLLIFVGASNILFAQLGVGNNNPTAKLEVSASSETNPTNSDGILVPRVTAFPATNPTQDGLMIYLKNPVVVAGQVQNKGLYYWNNSTQVWNILSTQTINTGIKNFTMLASAKIYINNTNGGVAGLPKYITNKGFSEIDPSGSTSGSAQGNYSDGIQILKLSKTNSRYQLFFKTPITNNYVVIISIQSVGDPGGGYAQIDKDNELVATTGAQTADGFVINLWAFSSTTNDVYVNALIYTVE